jgi:predicted nucleotidyltransferase
MNEIILNRIIALAKQYKVSKLIQFGSSLDASSEFNDFDFACDGLYDRNFFRFGSKLEELLNKPVDLIPLQPSSDFIEYIKIKGRILYESE